MKHYIALHLLYLTSCSKQLIAFYLQMMTIVFVYSFVDENNNKFNGATTVRINGVDVLAISSNKVMTTVNAIYI